MIESQENSSVNPLSIIFMTVQTANKVEFHSFRLRGFAVLMAKDKTERNLLNESLAAENFHNYPYDVIFVGNIRRRTVREDSKECLFLSFNENRLDPCPC